MNTRPETEAENVVGGAPSAPRDQGRGPGRRGSSDRRTVGGPGCFKWPARLRCWFDSSYSLLLPLLLHAEAYETDAADAPPHVGRRAITRVPRPASSFASVSPDGAVNLQPGSGSLEGEQGHPPQVQPRILRAHHCVGEVSDGSKAGRAVQVGSVGSNYRYSVELTRLEPLTP